MYIDVLKSDSILSTELFPSQIGPSENWLSGFLPQIYLRIVYKFISTAKTENIWRLSSSLVYKTSKTDSLPDAEVASKMQF